ncbi:MAG TPA: MMPL family transporter [Candidatus Deferrimicrobium sp.]
MAGIAAKGSEGSGAGIKVGLAGEYASAAEANGVIWQDMVLSFLSSFVLVLVLVYAAYRPPVAVLCAFVLTLFAALSWTLLFAYLLYGGLNIVTSIVAAMLIGLYVDYMIMVYHRFHGEIRRGRSPLQALETTFSETGKALLSSSATSCVAFFSVVVTSFRGLHELGVVAGFGILFCLLSTFLVMGSLLSWLAKVSPTRIEARRPGGVPTGWAERLVEGRSGTVVAVFSIFLFLSILGSARTRFDAGIEAIGPVDSKVEQVQRVIEEKFGRKGEPLFLVARADGDRRLAADFDALDLQGERWRRAGRVETFSSPATLVPPPRFQKESRRLLSGAGLPGRYDDAGLERAIRREMEAQGMVPGDGLAAYAAGIVNVLAGEGIVDLPGFARSGDPRATYFFNGSRNAIAAHLSPPGGRWGQGALAAMKEDVLALGPDFALTGPSLIFEEIRSSIVRESTLATFIAFAANWIIVWLHFRRLRDTALVMLPVTAGSLLTVGAMGAIGIPFNFFNVAGIALLFGFGVDYGIYYMQSRRESPAAGAAEALRRTGGGIALCALTTLASCGSIILSHYRGLASIGAVLCLGAVFCLLSTVLLLPSLIDALERPRT